MGDLTIAYLSAGTNLGDRVTNLERAFESLRQADAVPTRMSSFFETEPVGFREQPWFINVAIELELRFTPHELLEICQAIEAAQGRVRSYQYGPRTLDLDILLYGNLIVSDAGLIIPHPRLAERRFALEPLAELAPELIHPVLKRSIRSLLETCPDSSAVQIYTPGDST